MTENAQPLLPHVLAGITENPKLTIIWMHGLGADGHDFAPIVPQLEKQLSAPVKFIFPHAPVRPVTLNGGMPMPAWYDIKSIGTTRDVSMDDMEESRNQITAFIDAEQANGMRADQILLVGFSQGAAVAFHTGLRHTEPLAGIIALSGYIPVPSDDGSDYPGENKSMPILIGHGTHDQVVPPVLADLAKEHLEELGFAYCFKTYPMEHSVCPEEINDIATFINQQLS
ncbi:dienelactone hydrolase family protein [Pontiellaceae bacterium B1224]|nr:dienelactone hydrolase family protein [Pontiellaceae bacterium B1224]